MTAVGLDKLSNQLCVSVSVLVSAFEWRVMEMKLVSSAEHEGVLATLMGILHDDLSMALLSKNSRRIGFGEEASSSLLSG